MPTAEKSITKFLFEIPHGNQNSLNELLPVVYDELRRLARKHLSRERADHTLQPTALVHEAFLRLAGQKEVRWQNRAHFFGIAARLMREILIEHARMKNRQKRGGAHQTQITLDDAVGFTRNREIDVIAVDEALRKLETLDPRQARIVEMKFFGGLSVEEIAEVLGTSESTVKREWATAKLLLNKILS